MNIKTTHSFACFDDDLQYRFVNLLFACQSHAISYKSISDNGDWGNEPLDISLQFEGDARAIRDILTSWSPDLVEDDEWEEHESLSANYIVD